MAATATKAAENGAAATDAAFKAATDAANEFARTATEALAPSVEKATHQIQEYTDAAFAQAKKSAVAWLDAYDAGLATTIDLHKDLAAVGDVDWVKDVTARLTDFLSQGGSAYSRAARDLLK
jgi:hypothetical protein